jgi:EamA domain-containing membrane protein RarD
MIEIEWFAYGAVFGYFLNPLIMVVKAIIREAKITKSEWRKDGSNQ